ncbi:DUF1493 family protein [Hymenobacter taeanensis]|uniref:DUF1493 family protein n=1 Tax=Hymenobacter taeanensis TaxID=2735321 RepID=A0A6M6BKB4_9BACT|nr:MULTISPECIES: DUF1493 family protein [Hymenobacter]QJX48536.1 DUF1493 family protein [Hymenobacter taeanensis]UOQ81967.1 DUF1493 family protein [Hymenobacter sp. 5414T-23]
METIYIRFSDLRRAAEQVPTFVKEALWWEDAYNLRTGIEEDMGCGGEDTEELLLSFSERFSVDISNFDFTGLISSEPGSDGNPLYTFLLLFYVAVYLIAWVVKLLVGIFYWPFNPKSATKLIKEPIGNPFASELQQPKSPQEILTIGDLVASAAAGHFVKRERVRFVIVRPDHS